MLQPAASLSSIEAWLEDWFADRGASPSREENFFDAGAIDSFGVIELIEALESHFAFRFGPRDFQDRRFSSIACLAGLIDERLQQR